MLEAGTPPRRFRIVEAYKNTLSNCFFKCVRELLRDYSRWSSLGAPAQEHMSVAFAVHARSAGGIMQLIHKKHETYPYKLFAIVDKPEVAKEVADDKWCQQEEFTWAFCTEYPGDKMARQACRASLVRSTLTVRCKTSRMSVDSHRSHECNRSAR